MRYRLTDTALQDMRGIVRHIRVVQRSPQNAALVLSRLRASFRKLARLPMLGHVREEMRDKEARVLPVTGLLVIYDPILKPLTLLRVVHGARDLSRVETRP